VPLSAAAALLVRGEDCFESEQEAQAFMASRDLFGYVVTGGGGGGDVGGSSGGSSGGSGGSAGSSSGGGSSSFCAVAAPQRGVVTAGQGRQCTVLYQDGTT
jgi:hypothetical protein